MQVTSVTIRLHQQSPGPLPELFVFSARTNKNKLESLTLLMLLITANCYKEKRLSLHQSQTEYQHDSNIKASPPSRSRVMSAERCCDLFMMKPKKQVAG